MACFGFAAFQKGDWINCFSIHLFLFFVVEMDDDVSIYCHLTVIFFSGVAVMRHRSCGEKENKFVMIEIRYSTIHQNQDRIDLYRFWFYQSVFSFCRAYQPAAVARKLIYIFDMDSFLCILNT